MTGARLLSVFLSSVLFTALAASGSGCSCGDSGPGEEDADAEQDTAGDDGAVDTGDPAAEDAPQDSLPDPDAGHDPVPDPTDEDLPPADLPAEDLAAEDAVEEELSSLPAGCIEGDFFPFWGNLHSHTSYSDGDGIPAEAFAYARDVAGLDMLVVTDHLEQLYFPGDRWNNCRNQADAAYAPGSFLAMCGFEYGSGRYLLIWSSGHNNVFYSDSLFPEIQVDFRNFYNSLVACPMCIGQFNHPGDSEYEHWNHFEYHADTDQRMNLFEFNSDPAWELYFEALDAGWHVSPMYNQDNHSANWGTANDNRSGLFMSELTREALREAMLDRRSFAATDANAWARMMAESDCWMGSILSGVSSVTIEIEASDADAGDTFSVVEIFGPGRTLMDTLDCGGTETCLASLDVPASPGMYVVARVWQSDGDFIVPAPIWINP
jgi:hypothetical protein